MKKLYALLISVIIVSAVLFLTKAALERNIRLSYYDGIGDLYGSVEKDQGIILQETSAKRTDNILLYGSSDLGTKDVSSHPSNFFKDKKDGFQINLIGRGYSQSLIHTINFGALGSGLKDKKVVFFVSPPWFLNGNPSASGFNMNFSELQFYSFMFNPSIEKQMKVNVAKRVYELVKTSSDRKSIMDFCYLYSNNNALSKAAFYAMLPYHAFKYYLLSIKDDVNTIKLIKKTRGNQGYIAPQSNTFNWEEEKNKAIEQGKKTGTNNEFAIENEYYDQYLKKQYEDLKKNYKTESLLNADEYTDFKLLLDLCKEQGIKPLFINVPLKGKWYDYISFDKSIRLEYYKRINTMVQSYGFELLDLTEYEYNDYLLKDPAHIGWEGWVYINEAMDKYYHEK